MAITEITLEDGERALSVDTEEEFARALDRGLPIVAPEEIAAAFGFPVHGGRPGIRRPVRRRSRRPRRLRRGLSHPETPIWPKPSTDAPRRDHVGEYHRQFADSIIRQIEDGDRPVAEALEARRAVHARERLQRQGVHGRQRPLPRARRPGARVHR